MARSGVYKSEVRKARDALVAQGKHPSIDAVRAGMGNTGSKTTIHRYLRELAEEEGEGRTVAVSDAIQDLVGRLAARLHEEAETRLTELQAQYDKKLQEKEVLFGQQRTEIEGLSAQLQRTEVALNSEKHDHTAASQALVDANTTNERLTQQVNDLNDRLRDNEAHRQSLEEKHQHARDALEHFRESARTQREQENSRHEHQVQQLQVELRQARDALTGKNEEIIQLNRQNGRLSADVAETGRKVHEMETTARQLRQELEPLRALPQQLADARQQRDAGGVQISSLLNSLERARQDLQTQLSRQHALEIELATATGKLAALQMSGLVTDHHGGA